MFRRTSAKGRLLIASLLFTAALFAFAPSRAQQQQHLIGELTNIDRATGRLVIKSDAGANVAVTTDERTVFRRVPPGQTSLQNAERIAVSDLATGDRVLVPGGAPAEGAAARQVVVMAREAIETRRESERADWRQRGIGGRVASVDAAKREITIETRSREGAASVTVVVPGDARLRRYAQGSLRPEDAVSGAFDDIRVGDQLRAIGERSGDGARFTAEEIISGSVARMTGIIETIDTTRNEVVVKDVQSKQTVTIALVKSTNIRRIPDDFMETIRQRREERRGAGEANRQPGERRGERQGERRGGRRGEDGEDGERRRGERRGGGGGRGLQHLFESLPAITLADLKKGDAVIITGTTGADASRITAASIVAGDAEFFQRMQRFQRGPGAQGNMSPGLPGNVMGGNTGSDQP